MLYTYISLMALCGDCPVKQSSTTDLLREKGARKKQPTITLPCLVSPCLDFCLLYFATLGSSLWTFSFPFFACPTFSSRICMDVPSLPDRCAKLRNRGPIGPLRAHEQCYLMWGCITSAHYFFHMFFHGLVGVVWIVAASNRSNISSRS